MEETWSTYKTKPSTASIYTDDAVVIYVPTSAGARGSAQIRRFFLQPHFKSNTVKETVHNKVTSGNKIMEEAEWTITFHGGECSWLVPNVDEGVLLNATVKFPVIISATFSECKIALLRVYWDQASVLKQLRLITEKTKWPVRGGEQVDALRSPQSIPLNPFVPDNADLAPPKPNTTTKRTLAIDAPGRIFGPVKPEDEVTRPVRRSLQQPARNIFAYEPPPEKPLVQHNPNRLSSSFTFAHGGDETDIDQVTRKTASLNTSSSSANNNNRHQPKNILAHE